VEFVVDTVALVQVLQFPLPVSFQQCCTPEHSTVHRFMTSVMPAQLTNIQRDEFVDPGGRAV